MRILFISSLLCIISVYSYSQSFSGTYNPNKNGIGIIAGAELFHNDLSVLVSYEYGTYCFATDQCHISKYGVGFKYDWFAFIAHYNSYKYSDMLFIETDELHKYSFEIGVMPMYYKHFGAGLLHDPINNETRLLITYKI